MQRLPKLASSPNIQSIRDSANLVNISCSARSGRAPAQRYQQRRLFE